MIVDLAGAKRIEASLTADLPPGVPAPTVVVFSGGGYQAFWKLEVPIVIGGDLQLAEDAKRYNQQLEYAFGADNCHNIDRIMRLPGTINLPDERKRKKGRKPELARLVRFDPEDVYEVTCFQQAALRAPLAAAAIPISDVRLEPLEHLDALAKWGVSERVKLVIREGKDPKNPKRGDNTRSGWLFYCVCQLVRCGVPIEVIAWSRQVFCLGSACCG